MIRLDSKMGSISAPLIIINFNQELFWQGLNRVAGQNIVFSLCLGIL